MTEYRFIFDPAVMSEEPAYFAGDPVSSREQAEGQIHLIAMYTLHLHELSLMPDYTNCGHLESRDDGGEWKEIDEDDEE